MDFFGRQAEARRATWRLIVMFVLAIPCITALIFLGISAVLHWQDVEYFGPFPSVRLFVDMLIGTTFVVMYGSLTRLQDLRRGGAAVARRLGARHVSPHTEDLDERRLLNVIEEMAIASGVPVPDAWLLADDSINAFAAGFHTGDAAIAVTRGCLLGLTRDELQGVIAHEFSHILNGDMRLNLRLMGVTHGLVNVSVVGTSLMRVGMTAPGVGIVRRFNIVFAAPGLVLLACGWIGVVFARLIKSAIARQRELLADASAVQFTRNPSGIAGALKRAAGLTGPDDEKKQFSGSRIWNSHAEEASHMFFGDPLSISLGFDRWFATHPPMIERIRNLEPGFCADTATRRSPAAHIATTAFAPFDIDASHPLTPERMIESVGFVSPAQILVGRQILNALPIRLRAAAHSVTGARGLVFALLLHQDPTQRRGQLNAIQDTVDTEVLHETADLANDVAELDDTLRLPLVDLAMPALREMERRDYGAFCASLDVLRRALRCPRREVFVFCLVRVVRHHLDEAFGRRPRIRGSSISPSEDAVRIVGALALVGHEDPVEDRKAFLEGLRVLPNVTGTDRRPVPTGIDFTALGRALDRLADRPGYERRLVLLACARAIASDGVICGTEAELLRAVADSLDCPMPPIAFATKPALHPEPVGVG